MDAVINEAINFFQECKTYFEKRISTKIAWYHKLLGIKPRGIRYQEIVQKCDVSIEALSRDELDEVKSVLFSLIKLYKHEMKQFSKMSGNNGFKKFNLRNLENMRLSLIELNRKKLVEKLRVARKTGEAEITDIMHDPKCYLCAIKKISRENTWDLRCLDCYDALCKARELKGILMQNLNEEQRVYFQQYVKIMEHFCMDQLIGKD